MVPTIYVRNIREKDVGIIKRYKEDYYKLVHLYTCRKKGWEEVDKPVEVEEAEQKKRRGMVNEEKLLNNLSRSRSRVFELALCNYWEYFCTFTIDASKRERYDLGATYKQFAKWINNYNTRKQTTIRYLIVPEQHKDGAWHFHGLIMGLPVEHLEQFSLEQKLPMRLKRMVQQGRRIYNWVAYEKAFGYCTLDEIRDADACAAYMCKYITKDLAKSCVELNQHVFYASHGLKRAEVIYRGEVKRELKEPDFENEYLRIKRFASAEEAAIYFCDDCFT